MVLAVLAALYVGVDIGLRVFAQFWVSRELAESLALRERPDVSLGGFPFIPDLIAGSFDSVSLEVEGYDAEGVRIDRVEMHLEDVDVPRGQLLSGQAGRVHAKSGRGTAVLTEEDVTAALREQGLEGRVRFRGGGAIIHVDGAPGPIEAELSIEGGALLVEPRDPRVGRSYRIGLPAIVEGLSYTALRAREGELAIEFRLRDVSFRPRAE